MKESLGGISIFQIVIVFILLFTAIMSLTINHTKAFGVKDEIINILEAESEESVKNGKLSNKTIDKIVEALETGGYRTTGHCPSDYVGYDRSGKETSKNASFCIKAVSANNSYLADLRKKCKNNKCVVTEGNNPVMVYFNIKLFYQLDIPIIRNIFNFTINGSTKLMYG